MNIITENFKGYFSDLNPNNRINLSDFYSNDIVFKDPIHEIKGLENLKLYFANLNKNLDKGSFKFINENHIENQVFWEWVMPINPYKK